MPWTKLQKQIAARACIAAKISDQQRRDVILRHFEHADAGGGQFTSTAPRLNSRDFEQFMAIVEGYAGGQVLHFGRGYWTRCAADGLSRARHHVTKIATALEAAGKLAPGGVGLEGWIRKRVSRDETGSVDQLDYPGLLALTTGLSAYARQNGVEIPA